MTRARSLSRLANTNAFTVDASNNVGIGSTIPDVRLDVNGDMNVTGTLTYEDVTNVETAGITTTGGLVVTGLGATIGGITTFFGDLNFGAAGVGGTITTLGHAEFAGVVTATSFSGDGSGLTGVASTDNINTSTLAQFTGGVGIADSIFHIGDSNTAIRFPAADTFTVETAGSERIRIESGGDVGIGTVNPGSRLDVRNASGTDPLLSLYHSNADVEGEVIRVGRTDLPTIRYHSIKAQHGGGASSNYIAFYLHDGNTITSQSEILRLRGDGNVGINTVSPGSDLHVFGDGQNSVIRIENTGDGNSSGVDFYRERNDGPGSGGGSIFIDSDTASSHAELYIQAQSASANAGVTADLTDNNGVRILLFGGNGTNSRIGFECGTKKLRITADGHFEPDADNSSNLGSSSKRWANIYSADLQLSNEGSVNDVDGTWGQYTIQEGENDLFLLNRRNGKTYKFVLEEVD